jgi:hypothetical protein
MPEIVGWGTFTIEHVIYGFVLGLWPALRPQDLSLGRKPQSEGITPQMRAA